MRHPELLLVLALVSPLAACGSSGSASGRSDGGAGDGAAAYDSAGSGDALNALDGPTMADTFAQDSPPSPGDGAPVAAEGSACGQPGTSCMQGSDCCSTMCNGGGHCK